MGYPNISNFVKNTPLSIGVRVRAGLRELQLPQDLGKSVFLGSERSLGKGFLKRFHLFREITTSLETEI